MKLKTIGKILRSRSMSGKKGLYFYNLRHHLYREDDGPAVILEDGYKSWYANGKISPENS